MKKSILFLFCLFCLTFVSCKKNINVCIICDNVEILNIDIEQGSTINLNNISTEEGYYYTFDKTSDDISKSKTKIVIYAEKHEYEKIVSFYFDEELLKTVTMSYHQEISYPELSLTDNYQNVYWEESINFENNCYYYNYYLRYSLKTFTVNFKYGNVILKSIVSDGLTPVSIPESIVAPMGYYYHWNLTNEEIATIKTDTDVYAELVEYQVISRFYIDQELLKEYNHLYSENVYPNNIPSYLVVKKWDLNEIFVDDHYERTYLLIYELKQNTITYYDDDLQLDLFPNSFQYGDEFALPTYEKEGYYFLGWFPSDRSTYCYEKITKTTSTSLNLYARFVQIKDFDKLVLNGDLHFTDIKKILNNGLTYYQPQFPTDAPSKSVTDYDWTVSNQEIANVSNYSSLSGKKTGFTILQATLKSDARVIITCIIKVTAYGIYLASEEEANENKICYVKFTDREGNVIKETVTSYGSSVVPPTPVIYENLKFIGWDHDLYNICDDIIIKPLYEEGTNLYVGKKISIIGDSISTYSGIIPDHFKAFYPYQTADLFDYYQTWWMQMINKLGAHLFANNSYSGSCVATGAYASSLDKRLVYTYYDEDKPDVIFIYMGSNDCRSKISVETFYKAYQEMIEKLLISCPNATIIPMTLATSKFYSKDEQLAYNEVIKQCALENNLTYVEMENADISSHLVDSAHPNYSGMTILANELIKQLFKEE